jgi:hypothetical protein
VSAKKRASSAVRERRNVERVQTGVRLETRILNLLKALAAVHDLSLGDLLEGIVLHAFEGKSPFGADSLRKIAALREVYGLDLRAADAHHLTEVTARGGSTFKSGPSASGKE